MKRAYIPLGADQQGRYETGQWLPRRVDPDFVETYPTGPAPLEAAHGCYEPPEDAFTPADKLLTGYARGIVSALLVGAIVAFVLLVTQ